MRTEGRAGRVSVIHVQRADLPNVVGEGNNGQAVKGSLSAHPASVCAQEDGFEVKDGNEHN